jgi:hypothetical protein
VTEQELEVPASANNGGIVIPQAYQRLGAVRQWDPTPLQRLRFFITSFPGLGKTGFVMSNPKALVFDFEDTCRDVVKPKATVVPCETWADFLAIKDQLLKDKAGSANCPWEHVAFDTMDKAQEKANQHLTEEWNEKTKGRKLRTIEEMGSEGSGVRYARDHLLSQLFQLYDAGFGWSVTGHLKRVLSDDEKMPPYMPQMWPTLAGSILREAQVVGTIFRDYKTIPTYRTIQGRQVVAGTKNVWEYVMALDEPMPTSKQEAKRKLAETKTRYKEYLPDSIPIPQYSQFETFADVYNKALEQARDELQ